MSLSIGIVGLPNVGKSTLFNTLTEKEVDAENYPFCTIDPSVGVVNVPDVRLKRLSEISTSQKTIPAIVEFTDIAGLVKGASKGEGLGNKFLANIRETDAVAHVVRIFEDADIVHVEGRIDPLFDIQIINLELIEADKETVSKRIEGLQKDIRRNDKDAKAQEEALLKCKKILEDEKLVSQYIHDFSEEELKVIKSVSLITSKPVLYVLNKASGGVNLDEEEDERWEQLMEYFRENSAKYIIIDAQTEGDLKDLDDEDRLDYLQQLGGSYDGIDVLIKKGYELLGLMSYFTTGEAETRAWTTKIGSTAPQAGAAIHTDFEQKFIRAQVVAFNDLDTLGSKSAAKEKGVLRTEGKDYIVQDGDVIEFMV